ncbi:MAG: hypothetical protein EZS28_006482 [Streblomastix strix]|uniref:Uncharacterized protein n=1 Tax=Streblomastix strix TaxID=222440 RepID=A0A5J4WST6_9EUKA|nr:MAG: hypothetical protein EZS28_006482 [Streblomastix strix]
MTQRRLNQDDNNENSDSDVLPADLFQKQGNCCIVCGNIPAETQVAEFRDFMGQYYTILYVWLEEPNGKESIQALIYYQTQGGLNKIQESMNSRIYKFSIIDIEQQNDQLKVISEKFLILQSEKDTEQQKKYVKLLVNNGIIDQIEMFLKKINADIFEENQKGEKKSVASANDVLLTKFACNILILIHEYAPSSFQMAKYVIVAEELMKFLQNTPAHNINTSHIQALLMIMSNPNYYQQDLSRKEDILTLSHLLDHTNLEVKQYVLYLMIHILNVADSRTAQRKPHPFHEDLKRDGVAFFVYQNCLLNGDSVNMKNNAAIVLSVLLRAQKLQLNMLTALILQFKSMLDEKNDCTMQAQTLNLLCGIAANKSNIPDLVSDHFIETISKFIKSQYEDVKSYSLELLMIFAQNGYDTLIRNTLGDMKFLELVGDSYFPLDTQAIQLTMKWCKDEELQKMKKLQD